MTFIEGLQSKVDELGGGRTAAAQVLGRAVSGGLLSLADTREWDEGGEYTIYDKEKQPGRFPTYKMYADTENGHLDESLVADGLNEDEKSWMVARREYEASEDHRNVQEMLDALTEFAQAYDIPFDRDVALYTAINFAETVPHWDMSVC